MFIGKPIHDEFYGVIDKDNTSIWHIINNEVSLLINYKVINYLDIVIWAEIDSIPTTYHSNIYRHLILMLCL